MKIIAKKCFPKSHTSNRSIPCTKLALEGLQDIRVKHRWGVIDKENELIKYTKAKNKVFNPKTFSNGYTREQLLTRSRYLLYKTPKNCTQNQYIRA